MASQSPPKYYFSNDDGTVKVPVFSLVKPEEEDDTCKSIKEAYAQYKWRDEDFLLATYPKNGTHIMWEIMNMLLRGSADYIKESKIVCMMDLHPVTKIGDVFPSPRVLNTHYRLDVLPKEFRGRKTVCVLRNPKDTTASNHKFLDKLSYRSESPAIASAGKMPFSDFNKVFLYDKEMFYGNFFDYVEYMWSLRDDPNMLVIFFEDLKLDPVGEVQRVNEFMGTNRSPELVQQIADATKFDNMKVGKHTSMVDLNSVVTQWKDGSAADTSDLMYRKGAIGDWKNHLTVADNELFDSFLDNWDAGRDIPFKY